MSRARAVRVVAVIVVGLAAGAAAWRGLAPVEPFLEIGARLETRMANYEVWNITVKVRGGEKLDELRCETASGPAQIVTGPRTGLESGVSATFRVQIDGPRGTTAVVRVVPRGRISAASDVTIGAAQ